MNIYALKVPLHTDVFLDSENEIATFSNAYNGFINENFEPSIENLGIRAGVMYNFLGISQLWENPEVAAMYGDLSQGISRCLFPLSMCTNL